MAHRPRCPRCGGPVIREPDRPPPQAPTGTCVNCGLWFALPPEALQGPARAGLLWGFANALAVLAVGLVLGVVLALLAHFDILGGVLLVVAGAALVFGVAALHAGYLDRFMAKARQAGRRLHPPR
jgi:hypothetical protein